MRVGAHRRCRPGQEPRHAASPWLGPPPRLLFRPASRAIVSISRVKCSRALHASSWTLLCAPPLATCELKQVAGKHLRPQEHQECGNLHRLALPQEALQQQEPDSQDTGALLRTAHPTIRHTPDHSMEQHRASNAFACCSWHEAVMARSSSSQAALTVSASAVSASLRLTPPARVSNICSSVYAIANWQC